MIPVLKPHFPKAMQKRIFKRMEKSFDIGWIGEGPLVAELEEKWAKYTGAKYAVAVNSCTSALDIACRLGILPNPVRVSAFTFISSALAPINAGYDVEFVDIDPKSYCTKEADIQVMYAGNQSGKGIIYDMAHSGGVKHKGVVSCWSFHAVKNLPTGDGGMLTMNDKTLYERAKELSWCGISKSTWKRSGKKYAWDYEVIGRGLKAHMNDLTAAIALEQLKVLDKRNTYRKKLALAYDKYLPKDIKRPFRSSSWHLYTIQVDSRDELYDYLAENGIGCGLHYAPLYRYTKVFGERPTLPVTQRAFERIISLPMHMEVKVKDVKKICKLIASFYKN
jgi:perosamine synthetase